MSYLTRVPSSAEGQFEAGQDASIITDAFAAVAERIGDEDRVAVLQHEQTWR